MSSYESQAPTLLLQRRTRKRPSVLSMRQPLEDCDEFLQRGSYNKKGPDCKLMYFCSVS